MTVVYDGRLTVTKAGIEPCCRSLDRAVFAGIVYKGTVDKRPAIALRMPDSKAGLPVSHCPFCGAPVVQEGSQ